jgi:hypothetical protein
MIENADNPEVVLERIRLLAALPNQRKLTQDKTTGSHGYARIHGVTSVMALAEPSMPFAERLFNELAADAELSQVLLLLPSKSYHVTLRGLEGPLLAGAPCSDFARVDGLTQQRFCDPTSPAHPLEFNLQATVLPFATAIVLGVEPASSGFAEALDEAQSLVDGLGASKRNVYHVSVGYLLVERNRDRATDARIALAEQRVLAAALQLGTSLFVDPPKICYYESMEEFVPIFQS